MKCKISSRDTATCQQRVEDNRAQVTGPRTGRAHISAIGLCSPCDDDRGDIRDELRDMTESDGPFGYRWSSVCGVIASSLRWCKKGGCWNRVEQCGRRTSQDRGRRDAVGDVQEDEHTIAFDSALDAPVTPS